MHTALRQNLRICLLIARNNARTLRRNRHLVLLSFLLPVVFFTLFAVIFGGMDQGTVRTDVIVVDLDHSPASVRLTKALQAEGALNVLTQSAPGTAYTRATAQTAVRQGKAPAALILPKGFGQHPLNFGNGSATQILLLRDPADPVATPLITGLLQKTMMTGMPDLMANAGARYMDQIVGGFTPDQKARLDKNLAHLSTQSTAADPPESESGSFMNIASQDVTGGEKHGGMVAYYAAGIGVMFLLFTASSAARALLEEAEDGTLERLCACGRGLGSLLCGKLLYGIVLAIAQLAVMYLWGWAVFDLNIWPHIGAFFVAAALTAFACASFGLVIATLSRTQAHANALSTISILVISALGGSMVPLAVMPDGIRMISHLLFNSWAITVFTGIFWRSMALKDLWPQLIGLAAFGGIFFLAACGLARRWQKA